MYLTKKQKQIFKDRINNKIRIKQETIEAVAPGFIDFCKEKQKPPREELYIQLFKRPLCSVCGSKTEFLGVRRGFRPFCSAKCRANSPEQLKQTKQRLHSAGVQDRAKETLRKHYGVTCPFSSKQIQNKSRRSMIARFGVKNPGESQVLQKKRSKTMLKRYGVEHNMQNQELFEKQKLSGFKSKEVCIGGKTFKLRGYEDIAVDYLHTALKIPVNAIKACVADGLPSVVWELGERKHVYHPDLYVKIRGLWWIVEVKSDYTAGMARKSSLYGQLRRKAQATVQAGFRFMLMIILKPDTDGLHPVYEIYNADRMCKRDVLAYIRN